MVVAQDYSSRVMFEGFNDDFAGVDAGLRESASEHFFCDDDPVLGIEKHHCKDFMRSVTHHQAKIVAYNIRAAEQVGFLGLTGKQLKGLRDDGVAHVRA